MAQLRQDYDRIVAANLKLAVITPHPNTATATYQAEHNLTYPILSDNRRKAYKRYGLGRLSVLHEINPLTWLRNLPSLRQQGVAASKNTDMAQLGGVFVIDNGGTLRYVHIAHDAADNPPTAAIIAAAQEISYTGGS
jgi:peroxiredoxin